MPDVNFIFGINPIQQMLEHNPAKILEIWVSSAKKDMRVQKLLNQAQDQNISIQKVDPKKLDKLMEDQNHQGVIAKVKPAQILTESALKDLVHQNKNPLFLILDGVQDPHNFGACLRTADAAGVTAVIIPRDNAVGITPVVRKVASGAADIVPIVQVSNLARAMRELQDLNVWIVGTAMDCDKTIYELDLSGAIAIVLGAEGSGMRQLTAKHCDFLANLPMLGSVESLNVSVATGICLYEAIRQRSS